MKEYLPYIAIIISVLSFFISLFSFGFNIYKWNKKEKYRFVPPKQAIHPRHKIIH